MNNNQFIFSDPAPYPSIEVCEKNRMYAKAMLANVGSCNSEMSAVSLYFYNCVITKHPFPEISECFHKISIVEMHHLQIFSELASLCGADPRLWSFYGGRARYWSHGCNFYSAELSTLLRNAVSGEKKAIEQYRQQLNWIEDVHIRENLEHIIKDELCHVTIFESLYDQFCS